MSENIIDANTNKIILKSGSKMNIVVAKKLQNEGLKEILLPNSFFAGKFIHKSILF